MVFDTYQDRTGFIWICSSKGVARYDGFRFTYYTKANGLTDHDVFSLFEDDLSRLWAVTLNGIPCFFWKGNWYHPANTPWLRSIAGNGPIQTIHHDQDELVITCQKKVFFIKGEKITRTFTLEAIPDNVHKIIGSIVFNDELVIATERGFYQYREKKFTPLPSNIRFINLNAKMRMWRGRLVITHGRDLFFFNSRLRVETSIQTDRKELIIRTATSGDAQDSALIICTEGSIYRMSHYPEKQLELLSRQIVWASSYMKDRTGQSWVSSLTKGLFTGEESNVQKIALPGLPDGDLCSVVTVIGKKIWIGTEEGNVYVGNDEAISGKANPTSGFRLRYEVRKSESFKKIIFIKQEGDQVLAGFYGGLVAFDITGQKKSLMIGGTLAVSQATGDSLWIARSMELVKLKKLRFNEGDTRKNWDHNRIIQTDRVRVLTKGGDDSLWLGTRNGVKLLVHEKEVAIPAALRSISAPINVITSLGNGQMLIGTAEEGLYFFDGKALRHFSGDPSNDFSINQVLRAAQQGVWWIATNQGIHAFKTTKENNLYLENLTNRFPDFGEIYSLAEVNQQILIASERGLFYAPIHMPGMQPPKLYWEALTVEDTTIQLFNQPPRIQLSHKENTVQFSFSIFHFSFSNRAQYRYRLEPGNKRWIYINEPEILFQKLAPDDYTLEVQAKYPNSDFSPSSYMVFKINDPWWKTWWFRLLISCALLSLIVILFKKRIAFFKKQNLEFQQKIKDQKEKSELAHQLLKWRQEAEKGQLSPHFVFNAIYALQGYYGTGKIREGKAYAEKFSKLIRKQLSLAGKEFVSLLKEIDLLTSYVEWRNMKKTFPVCLSVEHTVEARSVQLPTLLLQPIVENCFDHGFEDDLPGQHITIAIHYRKEHEYLEVMVGNNGQNSNEDTYPKAADPKDEQSNGRGLALIHNRLEVLAELKWGTNHPHHPVFTAGRDKEDHFVVHLKIPCNFNSDENI